MSAPHTQTVVVDFDDTIAITLNRDWQNAQPNSALIDKLNSLYDAGWDIHIVTARGQISCGGDCVAAAEKYRDQIESWLSRHGMKFTSLSFQKKLASYYIDDKGITPEDFLHKFHREKLTGGMSGAEVYYDATTDAVYKTADNTPSAIAWYDAVQNLFPPSKGPLFYTPKIDSVIGNTIKMERLHQGFHRNFNDILAVCESFKHYAPLHVGLLPHMYVKRCLTRSSKVLFDNDIDVDQIQMFLEYAVEHTPATFGHGDFSISNIMSDEWTRTHVYLIDPINDPTLLSSWVIDLAKLYTSIRLLNPDDERLDKIQEFVELRPDELNMDLIRAHEIGHLCRMLPYADETMKIKLIDNIRTTAKHLLCFWTNEDKPWWWK